MFFKKTQSNASHELGKVPVVFYPAPHVNYVIIARQEYQHSTYKQGKCYM